MSLKIRSSFAALGLLLAACSSQPSSSSSTEEVRSITNAEAVADFDQMTNAFRGLYGAMERKQERYGFKFDAIVTEYRARVQAAKTEPEAMGVFQEFLGRFRDPHISLFTTIESNDSVWLSLPFKAMPVGDSYVVYQVGKGVEGVKLGDELLAIDGKTTKELYAELEKYQSIANPTALKHFVASTFTYREPWLAEKMDPAKPATLSLRGADGATRDVQLPWTNSKNYLLEADEMAAQAAAAAIPEGGESGPETAAGTSSNALKVIRAELNKQGVRVPYFMTPAVTTALNVSGEVTPSFAILAKYKITVEAAAKVPLFAAKYETEGKRVLLVRIPHYSPPDTAVAINYIKAIFEEQMPKVDALVLDDSHNPGGNIAYATNILSLLAKTQLNGYVQRMHADRLWLGSFSRQAFSQSADPAYQKFLLDGAHDIDNAYNEGRTLSSPLTFYRKDNFIQPDPGHWTKPVMMLQDSLSVSCGDLVPLVFKANKIGQTFGETTMGGGGSVETVAELVNTQAALGISRGVGTVFDPTGAYPEENVIEDNGVSPTIPYEHTLEDYRAGYIGYVTAFNKAIVAQIAAEAAAAPAPAAP